MTKCTRKKKEVCGKIKKICNPVSGRCIKINGPTYKRLVRDKIINQDGTLITTSTQNKGSNKNQTKVSNVGKKKQGTKVSNASKKGKWVPCTDKDGKSRRRRRCTKRTIAQGCEYIYAKDAKRMGIDYGCYKWTADPTNNNKSNTNTNTTVTEHHPIFSIPPIPCCDELNNDSFTGIKRVHLQYIIDNFNMHQKNILKNETGYRTIAKIPAALEKYGLAMGRLIAGGPAPTNGAATIFELVTDDGRVCQYVLNIHPRDKNEDAVLKQWRRGTPESDINTIPLIDPSDWFTINGSAGRLHVELQPRYEPISEREYYYAHGVVLGVLRVMRDLSARLLYESDIQADNFMRCNGKIVKIDFNFTDVVHPHLSLQSWHTDEFNPPWAANIYEWADKFITRVSRTSRKRLLYAMHLFYIRSSIKGKNMSSEIPLYRAATQELARLMTDTSFDELLGPSDEHLSKLIETELTNTMSVFY